MFLEQTKLLSTFAFLPPSSISTLIKMLHKNMTCYNYSALQGYQRTPKKNDIKKKKHASKHSHLNSGPTPTCTPIHDASESETQV